MPHNDGLSDEHLEVTVYGHTARGRTQPGFYADALPVEKTSYRRVIELRPWRWAWASYESPSGKFTMRWRGPVVTSSMTFYDLAAVVSEALDGD
jgi:hypothetical protein